MDIANNNTNTGAAKELREPIYASVWLALFSTLRHEFNQSRLFNQT